MMSDASQADLAERWRLFWNGDLSLGPTLIAESFVAHAAPLTGVGDDTIRGRAALDAWIEGIHDLLDDLAFTFELGPISDREFVVVRWRAQGRYRGGFPGGSPQAVGRNVTFTGTDMLRITDGKIEEYWANADSLLFIQQLGVTVMPNPFV